MRAKLVNNNHNNENNEEVVVTVPRIAENGYRLPDPLPTGVILTDSTKRQWILGKSIGCGGFGEIYCAKELPETQRFNSNINSNDLNKTSVIDNNHKLDPKSDELNNKSTKTQSYNGLPKRSCVQKLNTEKILLKNKEKMDKLIKDSNYPFVVKVDHISGPLYAEMHFYHRVAKPKQIDNWMLSQRLAFIGMPRYVASGIHIIPNNCLNNTFGNCNNSINPSKRQRYRFLVWIVCGLDLQKVLNKQNNKLSLKSSYTIAMMVIDILAYIHSFGYIHADIKASNLLLGRLETTSPARELYLVDYGLVERYRTQNGEHKEEEEDNRRANSGTIEFTSRDGHVGALSRRSDLEILVYNTISWLSGGRLPWINCKCHEEVRKQKEYYMSHIDELLKYAFKSKSLVPKGLEEFVRSIARLGFKEDPDYAHFKLILTRAIVGSGFSNDGLITWGTTNVKPIQKGTKRPASSSPELGRGKARKLEKLEFEQLDLCQIPRKMGRNRGVRSAPTTLSRQRSGSISPTSVADIELSNPTPQMLEVMERMKQKSEIIERETNINDSHHISYSFVHKKRIRTYSSGKRGRPRKSKSGFNKRVKSNVKSVAYETIRQLNSTYNDFKSDRILNTVIRNKKRKSKKCSILKRKCSVNRERIPLQKLEINVKTTNTNKRSSIRAIDGTNGKKQLKNVLKRKQKPKEIVIKSLITRSKSKVAKIAAIKKKLKRKPISTNRSSCEKLKVGLIVSLPNSPLKSCDNNKHKNSSKRIK